PREQEGHFQVEQDEHDGDQVIAHVEPLTRILEWLETALVRGKLLAARPLRRDEEADGQKRDANADGDRDEQKYGPVFGKHLWQTSAIERISGHVRAAGESLRERACSWCPRGDSNPHDQFGHYHLKVV